MLLYQFISEIIIQRLKIECNIKSPNFACIISLVDCSYFEINNKYFHISKNYFIPDFKNKIFILIYKCQSAIFKRGNIIIDLYFRVYYSKYVGSSSQS